MLKKQLFIQYLYSSVSALLYSSKSKQNHQHHMHPWTDNDNIFIQIYIIN